MLTKLNEMILGYRKVAGVEVLMQPEGMVFNLVILEKVKNIISIIDKIDGVKEIEELAKLIPSNVPVSICVQGKGVINRRIPNGTYSSELEILSLIFPNAKIDEFYLQQTLSDKFIFLSVARQTTIDEINQKLITLGISVVEISIGPFNVQQLIPFLNSEPKTINLQGITLSVIDGKLDDFATTVTIEEKELEVGDEKLKPFNIIPYTNALALFVPNEEGSSINIPLIHSQKKEYTHKRLFKVLGYGLLVFFVSILLINYIFYNYYKEENSRLGAITSSYQNSLDEVEKLEKKIEEKEYFMKKAGWLSLPKTSFYSDEIAASIPSSSIRLTSLRVNPLNEKISNRERKEVFKTDTILVAGTCSNPTALNPWMNVLKGKKWVNSLSNLNYTYDEKTRSGNFEIEIRIGDER